MSDIKTTPNALETEFKIAVKHYHKERAKDYKIAFKKFLDLFNAGYADREPSIYYYLGLSYLYGRGVTQDVNEGINKLKEGAKRNDLECCTHLGLIYQLGEYARRDIDLAFKYYTQAAKLGNSINYFHLASFHQAEKHTREAKICYSIALEKAAKDHAIPDNVIAEAEYNLAALLIESTSAAEKERAFQLFQSAADKGNFWGLIELGNIAEDNDKYDEAVTYFERAVLAYSNNKRELSDDEQNVFGNIYLKLAKYNQLKASSAEQQAKEAFLQKVDPYYKKAAQLGNIEAQEYLAKQAVTSLLAEEEKKSSPKKKKKKGKKKKSTQQPQPQVNVASTGEEQKPTAEEKKQTAEQAATERVRREEEKVQKAKDEEVIRKAVEEEEKRQKAAEEAEKLHKEEIRKANEEVERKQKEAEIQKAKEEEEKRQKAMEEAEKLRKETEEEEIRKANEELERKQKEAEIQKAEAAETERKIKIIAERAKRIQLQAKLEEQAQIIAKTETKSQEQAIRSLWQTTEEDLTPLVVTPQINIKIIVPLERVLHDEFKPALNLLKNLNARLTSSSAATKYQLLLVGGATRAFHSNIFFKTKKMPNDIDAIVSCDVKTLIKIFADLGMKVTPDKHNENLVRIPYSGYDIDIYCVPDNHKIVKGDTVRINKKLQAAERMCHMGAIFGEIVGDKLLLYGTTQAFSDLKLINTPYAKKQLTFCKKPAVLFITDPFRMVKLAKLMSEYAIDDHAAENAIREWAFLLQPKYRHSTAEKQQYALAIAADESDFVEARAKGKDLLKDAATLEMQRFSMLKEWFCYTDAQKRLNLFNQLVKLGIWEAFFPGSVLKHVEQFILEIDENSSKSPDVRINEFLGKLVHDASDYADIDKVIYRYNLLIWAEKNGIKLKSSLSPNASEWKQSQPSSHSAPVSPESQPVESSISPDRLSPHSA